MVSLSNQKGAKKNLRLVPGGVETRPRKINVRFRKFITPNFVLFVSFVVNIFPH